MMNVNSFLFRQIDNSALIVFRMLFGFLVFAESVGAVFTGWVRETFVVPSFTFTFIGFEWLEVLNSGYSMYIYYIVMGCFGLMVMVGYQYKRAIVAFTLMWTATYLMQKSAYNNHYYLLILISFLMIWQPAHRYASLDCFRNKKIKKGLMPQWCTWIMILQIGIVYTYAAVAKLYPDWLKATPVKLFLSAKTDYPLVGGLFSKEWFCYFLSYAGLIFDLLIVPLLLWKPSRKIAFACAILFHLFNSFVFQIGIFPYLSLAFSLFFFEPESVRKLFLKKKKSVVENPVEIPKKRNVIVLFFSVYFALQLLLPIRHLAIPGNVLWTEEGHRMSWRMMLRSKSGYIYFKVIDKATGEETIVYPDNRLSKKQRRIIAVAPDVIWQFVQMLKDQYNTEGREVMIYAVNGVRANGRPERPLIKPDADLASAGWSFFKHSEWLTEFKNQSDE